MKNVNNEIENPTTHWVCDICGGPINSPGEGALCWEAVNTDDGHITTKHKIVHATDENHPEKKSCIPKEIKKGLGGSENLCNLTGYAGLVELIHMIVKPGRTDDNAVLSVSEQDLGHFLNLIHRLHTPRFEKEYQVCGQSRSEFLDIDFSS